MSDCEKCGGSHDGRDEQGRLDFGELPAALAESTRIAIAPMIEAFTELQRVASPTVLVPSDRIQTTRVILDGSATGSGPVRLVPAEDARLRVTIVATYLTTMTNPAGAGGVQLVDVFAADQTAQGPGQLSATAGFPILTGGAGSAANNNTTTVPNTLTLSTSAAIMVALRSPVPAQGPIVVAALCEYRNLPGYGS